MKNYKTLSIVLGAILLIVATAGASVYVSKQPAAPEKVTTIHRTQNAQVPQKDLPPCNDGNIAGKAVGGIGGGVLGSMAGKGTGKTAATIAGTLGGAYIGGETIPLQNATCR